MLIIIITVFYTHQHFPKMGQIYFYLLQSIYLSWKLLQYIQKILAPCLDAHKHFRTKAHRLRRLMVGERVAVWFKILKNTMLFCMSPDLQKTFCEHLGMNDTWFCILSLDRQGTWQHDCIKLFHVQVQCVENKKTLMQSTNTPENLVITSFQIK